jgi:hypothetical protein
MPDEFELECPTCKRRLQMPAATAGRVRCPSCGTAFDGPAPASEPPATLAAADEGAPHDKPAPPAPSSTGVPRKPEKVQTIGAMMLIGGIYGILHFLGASGGSGFVCCLWPGLYYGLVAGILAIVKGSALLGSHAHLETSPKAIAIMQIICIINLDVPNLVMGILTLVFLNEPELQAYFRQPDAKNG